MPKDLLLTDDLLVNFELDSRNVYEYNSGELKGRLGYPASRIEPSIEFVNNGSIIQGGYKWSANISHLFYDVLVDFFVASFLMRDCSLSITPSGLAAKFLPLFDVRIIPGQCNLNRGDDFSENSTKSYLNYKWRFGGHNHSYISKLIRKVLYPAVQDAPSLVLVIHRKNRNGEAYSRSFLEVDKLVSLLKVGGLPAVKVILEELPIRVQVSLFARAAAVVAVHGSGLFWLNMCRKGTPVVEVATPYFVTAGRVKPDFWWISQCHGLRHVTLECNNVVGDAASPTNHDAKVDPEVILALLRIAAGRKMA
jgi:hypothetical protein